MCIHFIIRILEIAPGIIIGFLCYLRGFPGIPWGFPVTINRSQGISIPVWAGSRPVTVNGVNISTVSIQICFLFLKSEK